MEHIVTAIKFGFAAVGAFLGSLLGGLDGLLYAFIVMVSLDYLMGVMIAISNKCLSSEVGFRGITKKVMMLVLVAVGHIVDSKIIGNGSAIRTAILMFYIANEAISITENAVNIGLPLPKRLVEALSQIRDGGEKDYKEDK